MAKREKAPGMLIGIRKLRGGSEITDADEATRLHINADAVIADGDDEFERRVAIFFSDANAHLVVLRLVAFMRPKWRIKTVRALNRDGFGPPVGRAKPPKG